MHQATKIVLLKTGNKNKKILFQLRSNYRKMCLIFICVVSIYLWDRLFILESNIMVRDAFLLLIRLPIHLHPL